MSLFADDIIMYVDNPKESTNKIFELVNLGHNIQCQHKNSVVFLNTSNS